MQEILNSYGTEIAGLLGVALGWLLKHSFSWIKDYVKGTTNTIDDAVLAKVEDIVKAAVAESLADKVVTTTEEKK